MARFSLPAPRHSVTIEWPDASESVIRPLDLVQLTSFMADGAFDILDAPASHTDEEVITAALVVIATAMGCTAEEVKTKIANFYAEHDFAIVLVRLWGAVKTASFPAVEGENPKAPSP
jgi:hypothetical protein